jgi:hypothetical protein
MRTCFIAGVVSTLAAGAALAGDPVWYGGDWDERDGLISQNNAQLHGITYDDFTVTAPINVNEIFGNFLMNSAVGGTMTGMFWEIRENITPGDGGTVIIAGHTSAVSSQEQTGNVFGDPPNEFFEWNILIDVSAEGHTLQPGTYHLGYALATSSNATPPTQWGFVSTTSGTNGFGSPLANGNSYLNSNSFGFSFEPWDSEDLLGQGPWDVSFGLNGTVIPAPGAIALLGLAGLVGRRRRRN